MSIGPSEITKIEEVPIIQRFSTSAKKVVAQYFGRPAHYLFYILLTLGALALLIGKEPPIKFWILLAVIGVLNLPKITRVLPEAEAPSKINKKSNAKRSK